MIVLVLRFFDYDFLRGMSMGWSGVGEERRNLR